MTYIDLPLFFDGVTHPVTYEDVRFYAGMFPTLNVEQEFRNMAVWLNGNPRRRKTRRGIKRFISHWLIAAQGKHDATAKGNLQQSFDAPTLGKGWAKRYCWHCQQEYEHGFGDGGIFCSQDCIRLQAQKLAGSGS